MSKYSRFKVWADQMANKIRDEKFNLTESVLSQDEGANEALADLKQKKISEDAIADAVTCIAYADHCTQALQKELEAIKAENETIKAELATINIRRVVRLGLPSPYHMTRLERVPQNVCECVRIAHHSCSYQLSYMWATACTDLKHPVH